MPLTGFDPQSQQASARGLTPWKARALRSASSDVAAVMYQELLCQVICFHITVFCKTMTVVTEWELFYHMIYFHVALFIKEYI